MRDRKRPIEKEKTLGKQKRSTSNGARATGASLQQKKVSIEEDEESSESEEDDDVSRALFYYADNVVTEGLNTGGMEAELQKAKIALQKCKFLLLHRNPLLQKILKRASNRDMSDNKVPPGSSSVQRLLEDDRFLLSLVCINNSKLQSIIEGDSDSAIQSLKDALVFFPRSAEANENLAQILRVHADTKEKLDLVEALLKKAASSIDQLSESIEASTTAASNLKKIRSPMLGTALPTSTKCSGDNLKTAGLDSEIDVLHADDDCDSQDDDEADMLEEEVQHSLLEREHTAAVRARDSLTLYLCQENRCDEACTLLSDGNYLVRLSREVLCYGSAEHSEKSEDSEESKNKEKCGGNLILNGDLIESEKYVRVTDNALSPSLLAHLQHVFRATSPFWSEHHYDVIANSSRTAGYFSYVYPLNQAAGNSIEQVINVLFEKVKVMFPKESAECSVAEWWVHTRPHSSGHQLHFDSDNEGLTRAGGKPVHPVCSSVLYLQEGVGGPTLITDQILGGGLATQGWMTHPKTNRLALFDARYLHGVIPGRGPNPDPLKRRLTLMVGFWKDLKTRKLKDIAGPSQSFPTDSSSYTWHREMVLQDAINDECGVSGDEVQVPTHVSSVWEYAHTKNENEDEDEGSKSKSKGKGKGQSSRFNIDSASYKQCFQGF